MNLGLDNNAKALAVEVDYTTSLTESVTNETVPPSGVWLIVARRAQ